MSAMYPQFPPQPTAGSSAAAAAASFAQSRQQQQHHQDLFASRQATSSANQAMFGYMHHQQQQNQQQQTSSAGGAGSMPLLGFGSPFSLQSLQQLQSSPILHSSHPPLQHHHHSMYLQQQQHHQMQMMDDQQQQSSHSLFAQSQGMLIMQQQLQQQQYQPLPCDPPPQQLASYYYTQPVTQMQGGEIVSAQAFHPLSPMIASAATSAAPVDPHATAAISSYQSLLASPMASSSSFVHGNWSPSIAAAQSPSMSSGAVCGNSTSPLAATSSIGSPFVSSLVVQSPLVVNLNKSGAENQLMSTDQQMVSQPMLQSGQEAQRQPQQPPQQQQSLQPQFHTGQQHEASMRFTSMPRRGSFNNGNSSGENSWHSSQPHASPVLLLTLIHSEYRVSKLIEEHDHPEFNQRQRVSTMRPFFSTQEWQQDAAERASIRGGRLNFISSIQRKAKEDEEAGWMRIGVPTLDEIYMLFAKFGDIQRALTNFKDGLAKSFIQYKEITSAVNARKVLDNTEMKSTITNLPFGRMRISFSQYAELSLDPAALANGQARDYTALPHTLPSIPENQVSSLPRHNNVASMAEEVSTCVILVQQLHEQCQISHLKGVFGIIGPIKRIKFTYNLKGSAMIEYVNPADAARAMENLHGITLFQRGLVVRYSRHETVQMAQNSIDSSQSMEYQVQEQDGISPFVNTIAGAIKQSKFTCLHDVPVRISAIEAVRAINERLSSRAIRYFEEFVPHTTVKRIFLMFSDISSAVDALAMWNNNEMRGGYVVRMTFSSPRNELASQTRSYPAPLLPKPSAPSTPSPTPSTFAMPLPVNHQSMLGVKRYNTTKPPMRH